MALVQVKASTLGQHLFSAKAPTDQLAAMAYHCGLGKARDLSIRNPDRILELLGETSETRAKHNGRLGLATSELPPYRIRRCSYRIRPIRLLRPLRPLHNKIPAIVADKKFARVPASIARIPSRARSRFRSGTRAPIPPS